MDADKAFRQLDPAVRAETLAYQRDQLRHLPEWFRKKGVTQKFIANELGISESVLSRYISGETFMAVGTLRRIAVLLQARDTDLVQPPNEQNLAPVVEDTLREIDRLGPEKWARVLAMAKDMKGQDEK